jgi:hypothetical protein
MAPPARSSRVARTCVWQRRSPVRLIEASRGHMLMGSSLPLVPHVKMSLEESIGCLTKYVLEISVQENFFPTEG